ncbi:class I SAM-dependent methyltransferase [Bacillus rubiinfantis]|uniref:class I SAM-dependent methyltransferase n=1 Tax=Bacillus rubiinfantis TaxID=1499680 RepID=UPI0005A9FEC3|nr:SAM-dependent methyltransferase [Bacillus rubiinfantis]
MDTYIKNHILTSPDKLITYADYIARALYHPDYGYYMKEKQKIGRQGDFITTSNISDIYGRLMAKWFLFLSKEHELPTVFCEIGAGNGRFAQAFLKEWEAAANTAIDYIILETSPYHRKLQAQLLHPHFSVRYVESLTELKDFEGMIFSNEFFDALPVHVIEKDNGEFFEIMIGISNNQFQEQKVPLTNQEILLFLEESQLELRNGQRIEIPLAMKAVIKEIETVLSRGIVVTADYGYTNEEWMDPRRLKGSLRGFSQHTLIENVLRSPGDIDITSHIHLDYLMQKGEQLGLKGIKMLSQHEFLLKLNILKELEDHYDPNPFSEINRKNRAIRSLIMPGGISSFFQIIIQQKGLTDNLDAYFED